MSSAAVVIGALRVKYIQANKLDKEMAQNKIGHCKVVIIIIPSVGAAQITDMSHSLADH